MTKVHTGYSSMNLDKLSFFNLEDLDIVIKFLYVKARVEDNNYDFYRALYEKSILRLYGWVNDGKTKISEFITAFDTLIDSIEKNGFNSEFPIIIAKNNMILNGRHRLAICEYFGIQPVFVNSKEIGHKRFVINVDFYNTVFSDYELETIITDYFNNFKNPHYFMSFLWWDSEDNWEQIQSKIKDTLSSEIIYKKDFHFEDENHFQNVLEGIYAYENGISKNMNILLKVQNLKDNKKFRVLVCKYSGEKTYRYNISDYPICIEIEKMKFQIRGDLSYGKESKKYSYLHTSDNIDHLKYLCNFIFNPNIHFLKHIYSDNKYINSTHKFLKRFETFLQNNNVDRYDFCFDSGIILQIFWIRKAADLDFICKESIRSRLGFFEKNIDLHEKNRFLKVSKLSDDALIANRKNFFFYKGFKFVCPVLLIENSKHLSKKKNLDMLELNKLISSNSKYQLNIFYKVKVFVLLKYYWFRRRVLDIINFMLSEKQKYLIKKILNKYFGHNYNLFEEK